MKEPRTGWGGEEEEEDCLLNCYLFEGNTQPVPSW